MYTVHRASQTPFQAHNLRFLSRYNWLMTAPLSAMAGFTKGLHNFVCSILLFDEPALFFDRISLLVGDVRRGRVAPLRVLLVLQRSCNHWINIATRNRSKRELKTVGNSVSTRTDERDAIYLSEISPP